MEMLQHCPRSLFGGLCFLITGEINLVHQPEDSRSAAFSASSPVSELGARGRLFRPAQLEAGQPSQSLGTWSELFASVKSVHTARVPPLCGSGMPCSFLADASAHGSDSVAGLQGSDLEQGLSAVNPVVPKEAGIHDCDRSLDLCEQSGRHA